MSWLYTIFVAGLLFSNGSDLNLPLLDKATSEAVTRRAGDLIEKSDQTYPLNKSGRLSVSNVNGPIVLEAWDRNEVQVEVTKIADSQESMDLIEINIDAKRDYLCIESEINGKDIPGAGEHFRNRKIEVQFRLKVPRNAVLNEIEAVNGNVTASNFTNVTKISVVNGTLIARNLQGVSKLSIVNGEIRAAFDQMQSVSSIDLESVNGRVNLEVPSDINATLRADSLNGSIGNDFGLPVKTGKHIGRDLHGRIGSGEIPLHLTSVNGNMFISRKKDGKTPASVTNLLNSKSGDDEEEDETEVSMASEAVKAEAVAPSVNRAVRNAERSAKATQKEIEKVHAQSEKMKIVELPDVKIKLDEKEFKNVIAEGMKQFGVAADFGEGLWSSTPVTVDQRSASFDVKGAPRVTIDASMCTVRVRGWDQPTVKYVLTEERFAKDNTLRVTQNATEHAVNLKVLSPARPIPGFDLWAGENRFRIEVYVPRKADVTVTTQQDIRVEGVSGKLDLNGESGSLSVRDSDGSLRLRSKDGLIRVIGFSGDLDITTSDSDVFLEGQFAKITADAGDANVTLTMPSTQNASISTNTAIQSEGLNVVRDGERKWRLGSGGPKYEFEFAEGGLVLRNQSRVDVN